MKCIKKNEKYKRVDDQTAEALVKNEKYVYVSKSKYKKKLKDGEVA